MRRLLLVMLLVSGCASTRGETPCDSTEDLISEGWQNYRAERAFVDSTFRAYRDSILDANFAKASAARADSSQRR